MLALRLRTSATCPRLSSCLSVSLRNGHLEKRNNLGNKLHRAETEKHEAQSTNRKPPSSPEKKNSRGTVAFQGGAFSPFPPGSNRLFSSLLGLWPCCRKVLSAVILVLFSLVRVSTLSVGDEIFPPWLEFTPAIKKPLAVVRPSLHVPSFGGPCCPGVLRPVPADDDLSSSSISGSILPSMISKITHASGDGLGSGEQGLQYCTVSTCVTVICTCGASRLRFSTYRLITAYSSSGSFPFNPSTKSIVFYQGLVIVSSAVIEIAALNAFTSDHKPS